MNATKKKYCIQFRSFYFILLACLMPIIASAACTKDDLKKMVEKGFSLEEMNRICGAQAATSDNACSRKKTIPQSKVGMVGDTVYPAKAVCNDDCAGCCVHTSLVNPDLVIRTIPDQLGSGKRGYLCLDEITTPECQRKFCDSY